LGSYHPEYKDLYYEVNYGYIEGVMGKDNEELDAYVLGVKESLDSFRGKCIAVIERTNDNDDKLIVVPIGSDYSNDEIIKETYFQEKYFKSEIIRINDFK
jgi:inorganic pyrophosphatase